MIPRQEKIAVMGHVVAGDVRASQVASLIDVMVESGVKIIEIQIPFSEPIADGPLFLKANHQAIQQGVNHEVAFELMSQVSAKHPAVSFVFMTYVNIIFKIGYEAFVKSSVEAGAKGVIVPDFPIEHSEEFLQYCEKYNFCNIQVIPPNIDDIRLAKLCSKSSGFVYAVARLGVTGKHTDFGDHLDLFLGKLRKHTKLPIAVGFGVRSYEDVSFLQGRADLAVIGSRGLEVFLEGGLKGAREFWQSVTK